ncbi:MAG: hypothetical protein A2008_06685 [Candidatus Wallbacteria bacterium GWC2_49_35]|uniref:DUF5667 domain-containing protein n=1 Tax=Candidatus Wallbacteria bacterium GWC2_49_35 TaxID=1817813 RepID=A0A1F7WLB3_9BACT|nr:MAG: hypothetical protein A2008_06685 [Candidatus Wallbacteria bacterium GWC2_49_35]HBC76929.1 hypothetical protein [Candidatus Wallbacteria bacterium]
MKINFLKLAALIMVVLFLAVANGGAFAEEKKAKKTAAKAKKTTQTSKNTKTAKAAKTTKPAKAAAAETKKADNSKKSAEEAELKAIYDQKMIDAVKLFSQKKSSLSQNTRAELEDILTISATQAREGNYEDAIFVIDEIETVLSGRGKQTKNIKVEDASTGEVKNYQFDVNKDNKVVSAGETEEQTAQVASEDETATEASTTAPDGKFSLERLSTDEQKLYKDLVEVLPIAEFEFNKKKNPETARRLMRLRRVFYTLKKKGMGHTVDEEVINELISETKKSPKKSK